MEWSNGYWICYAPESFIQYKIAQSLFKWDKKIFVTLEDTVRDILNFSHSDCRGRPPRSNASGRVDIIVWNKKEEPLYLIEVKKFSYINNVIDADVKRLKQLVKKENSIHDGFVAVYSEAKTRKTISNRFEKYASSSKSKLTKKYISLKSEADGYYWGAAVFSVSE